MWTPSPLPAISANCRFGNRSSTNVNFWTLASWPNIRASSAPPQGTNHSSMDTRESAPDSLARISAQLVRGKGSADFVAECAAAPPGHGGVVGQVGLAEHG